MATDRTQTRDRCRTQMRLGDVSLADQGRNCPSDSNIKENPELLSEGNDAQAGHT